MMERILDSALGVYFLLLVITGNSKCEQTCSPPDFPVGGSYNPRQDKFQPGDTITYICEKNYALMGKDTNRCQSKGEWLNPSPFCDLKAILRHSKATGYSGHPEPNQQIIDGNRSSCFPWKAGDKQTVYMDKQKMVYAVRLFLESGNIHINIYADQTPCQSIKKMHIETNQWFLITCNDRGKLSKHVTLENKGDANFNSNVCEIEVYVKDEGACDKPPDRKVANGYFEVSRSKADLKCEYGFRSNNSRLVCEGNEWKGDKFQCEEILCSPELKFARKPGSEWTFLDPVKKISAGTRRQLKCSTGYQKTGDPDIIVCQKNGNWTDTAAICIEERKVSTRTIIYIAVGTVVLLVIIVLLGTTIYFVRKQRKRPVVVIYKSPTEGSVISGSEGDYATVYYENIRDYENIPPLPPTSSRPTAQMLTEGYFLPLDSKNTIKKQQTPADIAFDTLKQSTLYGC